VIVFTYEFNFISTTYQRAAWSKPASNIQTPQAPSESDSKIADNNHHDLQVESVSSPPLQPPSSDNSQQASVQKQAPVSWATLFKSSNSSVKADTNSTPPHRQLSHTANLLVVQNGQAESTIDVEIDNTTPVDVLKAMGNILKQCELKHSAPALQPRGIRNKQSWCYINATLQALLACPPFYNLIKSIFQKIKSSNQNMKSVPCIAAL